MLYPSARRKLVYRIKKLVRKHHFNIHGIDVEQWCKEVDDQLPALLGAPDERSFEECIHDLLGKLKSSHIDFYHQLRTPLRPEHAIGATLRPVPCFDEQQWMFLDVFEDGPAGRAGVVPGHLLLNVNGIPTSPPDLPAFSFEREHEITIGTPNTKETRNVVLVVPQRKSSRPKLPFVEPKSVSYKMLTNRVGIVKVVFFPGMFGMRFAKTLDNAIESLKAHGCDRLIIDLRGCLGGSLGFARLASYLCPDRIPIGYDVTRNRQQKGYSPADLPKVKMPDTRLGVLFRLAEFSFRDKSLMLLTQGLGKQPFHGNVAILTNECTSSAGEIIAQFAKDTRLATLIGQKTAGMVLGSAIFQAGAGYTLYLPVFGWYSHNGTYTEGSGVVPDIFVDIDPRHLAEGIDSQLDKACEILS